MSTLVYECESWKLTAHVQQKLNNTISKMLSRIAGRSIGEEAHAPAPNIVMNMKDRRRNWLGHILRVDEDRLVRKVL